MNSITLSEFPLTLSSSLGEVDEDNQSRYVLEEKIGTGGFGKVYLASDSLLERPIAIKIIDHELSQIAEAAGAAFDEARILASVEHPNILPVYDAGRTERGEIFIVSKYIEGLTLEEALFRGILSRSAFLEKIIEICAGLEAAHQEQLSHQDVKPENVLLDKDGKAILIDFGIARFLGASRWYHSAGTPEYMSPEQIQGQDHLVDGQSDIYSLGAILFRGLVGFPVPADWMQEEARQQFERTITRNLSEAALEIPPRLIHICHKALAFQKSRRYASAQALQNDLREFLSDSTPTKSKASKSPLVHRGLRAFGSDDSSAFLELLPGAREPKSGLPTVVDEWKKRIETHRSAATTPIRVGMIYGPSGSGKSSLLSAGILPQLDQHIIAIQLNASGNTTETLLKQKLGEQFLHINDKDPLPGILRKLRLGGLPTGSKLLIVIDQFEQWLHHNEDRKSSRLLVKALRQCDGVCIQAILIIREEFWQGASQFMQELDIPMRQDENITLCTPFDREHTRFVLEKIASTFRIFKNLPKRKQQAIIRHSLSLTEQKGHFPPVNIAILVQLYDHHDWSLEKISQIKSLEDLGQSYLETIFQSDSLKNHKTSAESFLLALVPATGLIRKEPVSRKQLLTATKLDHDQPAFDELTHTLDHDLRLISPAPLDDEQAYQLSHDYLVGALRNWSLDQQSKSLAGYAQIQLRKKARAWISGDRKKLLPGPLEWLWLNLITAKKRRNDQEHLYLRAATRHHVPRLTLIALFVITLATSIWIFEARKNASATVDRLIEARPGELQSAVTAAKEGLFWNKNRLKQISVSDQSSDNRWRAILPLLDEDPSLKSELIPYLITAKIEEVAILVKALQPLDSTIETELIAQILDEQSPACGLRAVCALATAKLPSEFWQGQGERICSWYESESAPAQWNQLLSPHAPELEEVMSRRFKNGSQPAAQFLSEIYANDHDRLKNYFATASADQLPILLKNLTNPEIIEDLFHSEKVETRANAIVSQLSLDSSKLPPSPDDLETNSFVLARGKILEAGRLAELLRSSSQSPTWLRISCLLLSQKDPKLLNPLVYQEVKSQAESLAKSHPKASVHAASCHLLRQWQCPLPEPSPPPGADWSYFPKFDLRMSIQEPPSPLKRGAKQFEIAMLEMSAELAHQIDKTLPKPDPNQNKSYVPKNPWHAMGLCNALSRQLGLEECYEKISESYERYRPKENYLDLDGFRLPTVEEWQFACGGPEQASFSFGCEEEEVARLFAWLNQRSKNVKPPALLFPCRSGLHDLHGNLAELCLKPFPYNENASMSDITRALGPRLSAKGGAFMQPIQRATLNHRGGPVGSPVQPSSADTVRLARTRKAKK